jgi:hypothetical protein
MMGMAGRSVSALAWEHSGFGPVARLGSRDVMVGSTKISVLTSIRHFATASSSQAIADIFIGLKSAPPQRQS